MPFISVCIPAYKNKAFVERLLKSIAEQSFKDYEVVLSDDSPDNELELVCNKYATLFPLQYFKNKIALGTPENWNFAISKAKGSWIKMMHHDDWFANKQSLQFFANAALNNPGIGFIFSGYDEVQDNKTERRYIISSAEETLLKKSPLNIFKANFVGSPSTTLIKNDSKEWYDKTIKWVVDFEYYMRYLKHSGFVAIKEALINIGIHSTQVTKESFRNPNVEIPENLYMLNKIGEGALKNVFVYDYYWRLFRNLEIRNFEQIKQFSDIELPQAIINMLKFQFQIPLSILKIGACSKTLMMISKTFL